MLKQWRIKVPSGQSIMHRLLLVVGIVSYVALFNSLYISWLAPTFSYMGMTYTKPASILTFLGWGFALLPAIWMPIHLRRVSQLPYWFLYLLVYIPSLFAPSYMALESRHDLLVLMLCLLGGFGIISVTYLLRPVVPVRIELSRRLFWLLIATITVLLDGWVVWVYHSRMHLVGFNDVYDLRWAAAEAGRGTGVDYATMLLSSVINPLYMAFGLFSRRKSLVLLGFLQQLMIYSCEGSKAVILSLAVIAAVYFATGRTGRLFSLRLLGGIVVLLLILAVVSWRGAENPVLEFVLFLLFARTVANAGYTTGIYANFFHSHPLTHLSSVHGVGLFVHYPYGDPLGIVLGVYEMGNSQLDINAHLWASDGIAAFGPVGILLISLLCLLVFWILDCSAIKHNVIFASLVVAFITINLANVSLFTTLFSGGLALVILLLVVMPETRGNALMADAKTANS